MNWFFAPTLSTLGIAAIAIFSCFLWILVRKKFRRVWFPALRILETPPKRLPKVRIEKPPFIPFLCFLSLAAAMVFLSFRPFKKVYVPLQPEKARVHMLLDLSPSVSAFISESEYREKAKHLIESFSGKALLTVSTTLSDEVYRILDDNAKSEFLNHLRLQQASSKIGDTFARQSSQIGAIDQLIILSDSDRYSWESFSWQAISSSTNVFFVNVEKDQSASRQNVFIGRVENILTNKTSSEWEVELVRNFSGIPLSGTIKATSKNIELTRQEFHFRPNDRTTHLNINIQLSDLSIKDKTLLDEDILWSLDNIDRNVLRADDYARVRWSGERLNVLILGSSESESTMLDPLQKIATAFQALNIIVTRLESLHAKMTANKTYDLAVLYADPTNSEDILESSCASSFLANSNVWIVPQSESPEALRLACSCSAKLLSFSTSLKPELCREIANRETLSSLLKSTGAHQVGGAIAQSDQAIAFEHSFGSDRHRALIFLQPINPKQKSVIHHGNFPLMIRELVNMQFPNLSRTIPKHVHRSRVTYAESLLDQIPSSELPPQLIDRQSMNSENTLTKQIEPDPIPIWIAVSLIVAMFIVLECIWWKLKLYPKKAATSLVLLLSLCFPRQLSASIQLVIVGQPKNLQFDTISKEIAARTSIELRPEAKFFSDATQELFQSPWMWIVLTDRMHHELNRREQIKLAKWFRRGGFAIIEGDINVINGIFSFMLNIKSEVIAPDHELMRSFYLTHSTPTCKGIPWKALQFDGRLIAVAVPKGTLSLISDNVDSKECQENLKSISGHKEQVTRAFVNTLMVALATDYKRDQIHLPEILKRLK